MTALDAPPLPVGPRTAPPANRFRRPGWRDPRLVIGVLLVCLSVVLGARVLGGRDDVTQIWSLRDGVAAGETLGTDQLRPIGVRFADEADAATYASADRPVADGTVATRDLAAGELLPLGAMAPDGDPLVELPLTVPGGGVPAGTAPGDRVDVWVVPRAGETGRPARGAKVLADVPVLRVGGRGLGGPEARRQVVVGVAEEARLARVVGRLADADVLLVRRR